jgi:spermidine/putrescine transport system permease protein
VVIRRRSGVSADQRGSIGARNRALGGAFIVVVMLYLFLPVVVTVLFSFTTSPRLSLPIEGLTTEWYGKALANPLFSRALVNTVILAIATAIVASALGVSFAFGVVRLRRRARGALLVASLVPAAVPALVLGIALALLFNALGRPQGILNAAFGHIVIALPFVVLTMNARLATFEFSTLEAARDLGASSWRTFWDITLPLIRPSVLGAGLIAMALSVDEFVVTWFNIGNQLTIPVLVWGLLRRGIDPSVNALATMILTSLIILVILSNLLSRRRT